MVGIIIKILNSVKSPTKWPGYEAPKIDFPLDSLFTGIFMILQFAPLNTTCLESLTDIHFRYWERPVNLGTKQDCGMSQKSSWEGCGLIRIKDFSRWLLAGVNEAILHYELPPPPIILGLARIPARKTMKEFEITHSSNFPKSFISEEYQVLELFGPRILWPVVWDGLCFAAPGQADGRGGCSRLWMTAIHRGSRARQVSLWMCLDCLTCRFQFYKAPWKGLFLSLIAWHCGIERYSFSLREI